MIDKIFICHWDKLTDRKEELIKVLSEENIFDYEFVCDYDKDTWSEEEIKYDFPKIFEVVEGYGRKLKSSEISLSLKHIKIIREVAEKYEYALVLEDDVILCDNFVEEFFDPIINFLKTGTLHGWEHAVDYMHQHLKIRESIGSMDLDVLMHMR